MSQTTGPQSTAPATKKLTPTRTVLTIGVMIALGLILYKVGYYSRVMSAFLTFAAPALAARCWYESRAQIKPRAIAALVVTTIVSMVVGILLFVAGHSASTSSVQFGDTSGQTSISQEAPPVQEAPAGQAPATPEAPAAPAPTADTLDQRVVAWSQLPSPVVVQASGQWQNYQIRQFVNDELAGGRDTANGVVSDLHSPLYPPAAVTAANTPLVDGGGTWYNGVGWADRYYTGPVYINGGGQPITLNVHYHLFMASNGKTTWLASIVSEIPASATPGSSTE